LILKVNAKVPKEYVFENPFEEIRDDESVSDLKIQLVSDQPYTYATIDHIGSRDPLADSLNPFVRNYIPKYANSLEEFESP
jgi:hypothetical protein